MSTGNGSFSSSIANIALPPQNPVSTSSAQSATASSAVPASTQVSQYDYYSSPEYQQYYQQYYANAYSQSATAYAQQQYAAYYQAGSSDSTLYNAMYGQTQANYLPGAYQALATSQPNSATQATAAAEAEDDEDDDDEDDDDPTVAKQNGKLSNILTYHCNSKMGLNPLIYTNIQQSPYFKNNLFQLKTYHEVIDEIYYSVKHLEPWEQGSRKVSGQTGMCGSVRGVGAGGIISTPFCILYKLYTLRLTRKQVTGLIRHKDSPFIRGLGFMYIRYTQPPQELWQWLEPYLNDTEEIDPKAGGGAPMSIGEMVHYLLTKLDWFSTLFPRIPIPIQKEIEEKLRQYESQSDSSHSVKRNGERSDKSDSYYKQPQQQQHNRSDSKYSKNDTRSRKSRSRSPPPKYQDKRPKKYDDDRRYDVDRSTSRHNNRHYH